MRDHHQLSKRYNSPSKYPDIRAFVLAAIYQEQRQPQEQLWEGEPAAEDAVTARSTRARFLRKYSGINSDAVGAADRLEFCNKRSRCASGACPVCCRLFQRWLVREMRKVIRDHIAVSGESLWAISIVPAKGNPDPGKLKEFSIANLQRRLKAALDTCKIDLAIGGIDISFNEDREGRFNPFWSLHHYIIISADNIEQLNRELKKIFKKSNAVKIPIVASKFTNNAKRRSYALKINFKRRISYTEVKNEKHGKCRKCRNASYDKLRAVERIELFLFLDKVGLANRLLLRGLKPMIKSKQVGLHPVWMTPT